MWRSLALASSLAGCVAPGFGGDGECACTADYRMFSIEIVDRTGAPVPNLATRTVRLRDGADVTSRDTQYDQNGWYVVISDGDTSFLTTTPDRFRFDASGPQGTASFQFEASKDACGCHFDVESPVEGALVIQ